jgi:hypothetical protein
VCSFDVSYTSRRGWRRRSFSLSGGAGPQLKNEGTSFTNAIVTCVWLDGANRTPPILFTHNPAFNLRRRHPSRHWRKVIAETKRVLKKNKISKKRIVYLEPATPNKKYVGESPEVYQKFVENAFRGIDKSRVVALSDRGPALFTKAGSILLPMGFKDHVSYTSAVHQFLSPNDNSLHGAAKAAWRAGKTDFTNDVKASARLLRLLDKDTENNSQHYFERNIIGLNTTTVVGVIRQLSTKKAESAKKLRRSYERFHEEEKAKRGV